jgi:hypothetical protein
MDYLPNCFWQSASVAHVLGSLVVVLRPPLRQFASRLRIFPQFASLALGCRSEMSASTAKTSIASTRAGFFLYDAEWTKRSSAGGAGQINRESWVRTGTGTRQDEQPREPSWTPSLRRTMMFNNSMGADMDVASWLRSLGLERYEAAFRDNEITEKVLPRLTAEDLKDLGVSVVGHRRVLLDAIADLRSDARVHTPAVAADRCSRALLRSCPLLLPPLRGPSLTVS